MLMLSVADQVNHQDLQGSSCHCTKCYSHKLTMTAHLQDSSHRITPTDMTTVYRVFKVMSVVNACNVVWGRNTVYSSGHVVWAVRNAEELSDNFITAVDVRVRLQQTVRLYMDTIAQHVPLVQYQWIFISLLCVALDVVQTQQSSVVILQSTVTVAKQLATYMYTAHIVSATTPCPGKKETSSFSTTSLAFLDRFFIVFASM